VFEKITGALRDPLQQRTRKEIDELFYAISWAKFGVGK